MLRSRNMRTHKNCKGAEATDISVSFYSVDTYVLSVSIYSGQVYVYRGYYTVTRRYEWC